VTFRQATYSPFQLQEQADRNFAAPKLTSFQ